jgi:hypothetical protein
MHFLSEKRVAHTIDLKICSSCAAHFTFHSLISVHRSAINSHQMNSEDRHQRSCHLVGCQLMCSRWRQLMMYLYSFCAFGFIQAERDNQILYIENLITKRGLNGKSLFGAPSQCCLWHSKKYRLSRIYISMPYVPDILEEIDPCGFCIYIA